MSLLLVSGHTYRSYMSEHTCFDMCSVLSLQSQIFCWGEVSCVVLVICAEYMYSLVHLIFIFLFLNSGFGFLHIFAHGKN